MKIVSIVGARPNFVKMEPLIRTIGRHPGSTQFFGELEIPSADFNLGVGSGSHAIQTAEVMRRLEPVLETLKADLALVVGDVNSTLAASLPPSLFHDCAGQAVSPGTLFVVADTFDGWYMGPGTCPGG